MDALDVDEGLRWFEAARKAHLRVAEAERDRSYNFGFAHYLDTATGAHEDITLPMIAAFETLKAAYTVARHEDSADVDVYFECAAQACSRLGAARRAPRPGAAAGAGQEEASGRCSVRSTLLPVQHPCAAWRDAAARRPVLRDAADGLAPFAIRSSSGCCTAQVARGARRAAGCA